MKSINVLERHLKENGYNYKITNGVAVVNINGTETIIIPKLRLGDKILIYPKDKKPLFIDNQLVAVIDKENNKVLEITHINSMQSAKFEEINNQEYRKIKVDRNTYSKLKRIARYYGIPIEEAVESMIDEIYKSIMEDNQLIT